MLSSGCGPEPRRQAQAGAAQAPGRARRAGRVRSQMNRRAGETGLLAALLLTQLIPVRSTNLGGLDEWMMFELNSRGIVSVPYAYRPIGLIWSLPGSLLAARFGFAAFTPLYAAYALISAVLVLLIVRRLQPE